MGTITLGGTQVKRNSDISHKLLMADMLAADGHYSNNGDVSGLKGSS
jgi:hypothetical protein